MSEYYRVKKDGNKAYFIDPEGNRMNDHAVRDLAQTLLKTVNRPAYMYIGESWLEDGLYKVGYSHDPARRSTALDIDLQFCFKAYSFGEYSAKHFESLMHRLFKAVGLHREGEWFELTSSDVEIVKWLFTNNSFWYSHHWRYKQMSESIDGIVTWLEQLPQCSDWCDADTFKNMVENHRPNSVLQGVHFVYAIESLASEYKKRGYQDHEHVKKFAIDGKAKLVEMMGKSIDYQRIAGKKWTLEKTIA